MKLKPAIVCEYHHVPDGGPELISEVTEDQIPDDPLFVFEIAVHLSSGTQIRMPNCVEYVRIDADRLIDIGEGEIEFALAMRDDATIDVGAGKVRVDPDRLIEVGNRPIVATLFIPDQAAVVVYMGIGETESDRRSKSTSARSSAPLRRHRIPRSWNTAGLSGSMRIAWS
jgi:hypothetical protein